MLQAAVVRVQCEAQDCGALLEVGEHRLQVLLRDRRERQQTIIFMHVLLGSYIEGWSVNVQHSVVSSLQQCWIVYASTDTPLAHVHEEPCNQIIREPGMTISRNILWSSHPKVMLSARLYENRPPFRTTGRRSHLVET